jgi:hypothetical protein
LECPRKLLRYSNRLPQRDERLGWTGDIQIFAPTASYLYDCAGFLKSWLIDLALDQRNDGAVPLFIPNIKDGPIVPSGAWGDAAVIVPWALYWRFGDRGILQAQFRSLCGWVDYLTSTVGPSLIWSNGFQFGDWLDPNAPPEIPGDSRTDSTLIATAYFARSTELVSRIAGILERQVEEEHYAVLSKQIPRGLRQRVFFAKWSRSQRLGNRLRFGDPVRIGSRCCSKDSSRTALIGTCPRCRVPHQNGFHRNSLGMRCSVRNRTRSNCTSATETEGKPFLALSSDHGRDNHVGALGQHVTIRQNQSRRYNVVQSLRAGIHC